MSDFRTAAWRRYLTFWRRNVAADIDDEVRHHLESRIEELVANGSSESAARAQALVEFGDVDAVRSSLRAIDERVARRRGYFDRLDGLRQDLRYAARALRRTPTFTATVVVTLALGLGVNAAMFSFLDRVFLRPPAGVAAPAGISRLWIRMQNSDGSTFVGQSMAYAQYRALEKSLAGSGLALYDVEERIPLGRGAGAPTATLAYATANYFSLLGVRPAFGRFFSPDEDRVGSGEHVVVLADAFWRNRLHGDSTVLGQTLLVGHDRYTVIGVAPPAFAGIDLDAVELWAPLATFQTPAYVQGRWWESPNVNRFAAFGRLPTGANVRTLEQRGTAALAEVNAILWQKNRVTMDVLFGPINAARGPGTPMRELSVSLRIGGVALVVLLIACANVVNLLLARAVRRRREIAVRLALGVSRARLVRLLVAESLLLAMIAAVAALLAASWGGQLLRSLLLPDVHWADAALHARVAFFTILISFTAGGLAGLVPAIQASRPELTSSLKASARDGGAHRSRLRASLIVVQAALSVVLLAGAALFVRSLENVHDLDLGYDVDRLVFGSVAFGDGVTPDKSTIGAAMREVADRVAELPGVERVGLSNLRPMAGFSVMSFYTATDSLASFKRQLPTMAAVSPGYLSAIGLRVLEGSDFPQALGAAMPPVFVVNGAMAKLLWPNAAAVGQCVRFVSRANPCYTVVGVVENARRADLIEEPTPQFYLPLDRMPVPGWTPNFIVVRTTPARRTAAERALRVALQQALPAGQARIETMSQRLEPMYRPWRLGATLFSALGVLALLVAAVGIYSTVSYSVSQRTHEFGVRVALGARMSNVLRDVVGEGLRVVLVGVAIGIALAVASGRLIASLLFGISAGSPVVMVLVAVVLLVVAMLAALIPAWRAARVDPVTALRAD